MQYVIEYQQVENTSYFHNYSFPIKLPSLFHFCIAIKKNGCERSLIY